MEGNALRGCEQIEAEQGLSRRALFLFLSLFVVPLEIVLGP
jgi:hypothetical protein